MLVIDQSADTILSRRLENMRNNTGTTRCVHFNFSKLSNMTSLPQELKSTLTELTDSLIHHPEKHIYICEDGDIFILAPAITTKEGQDTIKAVCSLFNLPAESPLAGLYELTPHLNKLLTLLEEKQKLRDQRKTSEEIQRKQLIEKQKRDAILNEQILGFKEGSVASRRNGRQQKEIMVIEDDPFSRRLVENIIPKHMHLVALDSAEIAISTYYSMAPDVLFLDINLPSVTGHELLEKIIAIDPDAYIIMLSGNSDKQNIMQAMGKGAKGFAAKPFSKERILQYIERCPTIGTLKE